MVAKKNAYIYEITWTTHCLMNERFFTEVFYNEGAAQSFIISLKDRKFYPFGINVGPEFVGAIIAVRKVVPATAESVEFTDEPIGKVHSMNR